MSTLFVAGVSIAKEHSHETICSHTLDAINKCDLIIGEERKSLMKLLALASARDKKYLLLNEHSSDEDRSSVLDEVLKSEVTIFASDAGTPCISDPDAMFIAMCRDKGVIIKSLPGPSSVTSAISVSGVKADRFFFAGFPPRDKAERVEFFNSLTKMSYPCVFMERPYSLKNTLEDLKPLGCKISLSMDLGNENEINVFDTPDNLLEKFKNIKAPFVVVIPSNNAKRTQRK